MITLIRGMILRISDVSELDIDHAKYAVVLSDDTEGNVYVFLINSRLNTLISRIKFQVMIAKGDYPFLHHDSYIDCNGYKIFRKDKIDGEHDKSNVEICGYLQAKDGKSLRMPQ